LPITAISYLQPTTTQLHLTPNYVYALLLPTHHPLQAMVSSYATTADHV